MKIGGNGNSGIVIIDEGGKEGRKEGKVVWKGGKDEKMTEEEIIAAQCESMVKNINDPRIVRYYSELQVPGIPDAGEKMTRAEFLRYIINGAHIDVNQIGAFEKAEVAHKFADVDVNDWFVSYVYFAEKNGIIPNQYENTRGEALLRPNEMLSRAEAAQILTRITVKQAELLPVYEDTFIDVSAHHTLARYIQNAYNTCLIHGSNTWNGEVVDGQEGRKFSPGSTITLGETAKILYNMSHHTYVGDSQERNLLFEHLREGTITLNDLMFEGSVK